MDMFFQTVVVPEAPPVLVVGRWSTKDPTEGFLCRRADIFQFFQTFSCGRSAVLSERLQRVFPATRRVCIMRGGGLAGGDKWCT